MKDSAYIRYTQFIVVMVFLVIIAGGVVRMTQSGMGCPDWPKCFGKWIPPTTANQLPPDFEKYLKQQDIDHTFNVYHTWIEYINRLLGALLGIFILVHSVWSFRKFFYTKRSFFLWSLALVVAVGFQGWLGKRVVDANLAVVKITTHMLVALLIAAIPVYIIYLVRDREKVKHATLKKLTSLTLILLILQIVLGTEVREQIDIIAKSLNYAQRELWIDQLDIFFKIHRSFSLVILVTLVVIFFKSKMIVQLSKFALLNLIIAWVLIFLGVVMNYVNIPAIAQPLHLLFSSILIINLFAFRLKFQ
jgi:cytochrome c oxidase assembly protein subunit 15